MCKIVCIEAVFLVIKAILPLRDDMQCLFAKHFTLNGNALTRRDVEQV